MTLQRPSSMTTRRPARVAVWLLLGGLAAVALAACGGASPASGDVRMGEGDADAVKVVASDNDFEPATLELDAGAEVTVEVYNDGEAAHNFVISQVDLSTGTIEAGQVATATFTVPDEPVSYVCTFHSGMGGEITPR